MRSTPKRFWMVHGDRTGPTNYRHTFREDAVHEAKRLARNSPDVTFYVLEAVAAFVKIDVQEMELPSVDVEDDGIPF